MTTASDYAPERRHAKLTPGESLKIVRELQGLSQSELARRTGIAQSALSAFERGAQEIGLKRAKTLAAALQVHPAVIAFPDWEVEASAEVHDLYEHLVKKLKKQPAKQKVATKRTARATRKVG
jgi:transcriptional regulator with XRE-family HTH domain